MQPLVTIGIMSYNQEKFIVDAIDSVIAQKYGNVEVVIFDDCSSDGTVSLIKGKLSELRCRAENVIFHFSDRNTGNISANSNYLIKQASGKYVYILAGDDQVLPEFIDEAVQYMESNTQYGIVSTNGFVVDEEDFLEDNYNFDKRIFKSPPDYTPSRLYYRIMCQNQIFAPGTVIKKDVYDTVGLYDERLKYEDYEFWVRCVRNGIQIGYVDKPLVLYRRTVSSVSNYLYDSKQRIKNVIDFNICLKEKYLEDFEFKDRILIVTITCSSFAFMCYEYECKDGIERLKRFAKKYNVKIGWRTDSKDLVYTYLYGWHKKQYILDNLNLFLRYNNIRRIAIYGYGFFGKKIYCLLEETDVAVDYIIDRNTHLDAPCRIMNLNDDLYPVDSVFVTLTYDIDSVVANLQTHLKCDIFTLDDLYYEIYKYGALT